MAVSDLLEVYVPFTKREKDPKTGHLYVYGKITGSDLDNDQQKMDANWLRQAVPDWYKIGNLREQHDPKRAVGKAVQLEEKADGWYIGAKVVDKDAIEKVEEDVLIGFSIGVKNHRLDYSNKAEAPNGVCISGRIVETSLVDSPCLGTALIEDHFRVPLAKADGAGELQPIEIPTLERVASPTYGLPAELFDRLASPVKQALADLAASGAQVAADVVDPEADSTKADSADPPIPVVVNVTVKTAEPTPAEAAPLDKAYSAKEKREALAAGEAMENANGDPAYTIKTKADLRKAIRAVGRGSADHNDIRKHIIARARALGLESMVPDDWNKDGSLKDAAATKADADPEMVEKAEAVLREVRALVPDLAKADDGDEGESDDIAGAQEAISAIAKLIVSEAESLAMGHLNEAADIALLLDAVRALKWFQCNERNEQSGLEDGVMMLADAPVEGEDLLKAEGKNGGKLAPPFKKKAKAGDEAEDDDSDGEDGTDGDEVDGEDEKPAAKKKTATKADAPAEPAPAAEPLLTKAEAAEIVKAAVAAALAADAAETETTSAPEPETVTKAELENLVKAAVAQARSADQERIASLTADLTKATGDIEAIKAMPIPGGPVLTRTAAQQQEATKSDSVLLRIQADELLAKAEAASANRDLAQGYRDRARALLKAAV